MKKLETNIDMLLLIAGTFPMTYQYLTGLNLPLLVHTCSVFASIALEFVIGKQIDQTHSNKYGVMSIIVAGVFLVMIALLPSINEGLYVAGFIAERWYLLVSHLLDGTIHSVFALLIVLTGLSKRYNHQKTYSKAIETVVKQASDGHVCPHCGKIYKTASALKAHITRYHKTGA